MEGCLVRIETATGEAAGPLAVFAPSGLLHELGLTGGQSAPLRFGMATADPVWHGDETLSGSTLRLSQSLARLFSLLTPLTLSIRRAGPSTVIGPLVGLLIAPGKLAAVLSAKPDHVYCRYAAAAREAGGLLLFFAPEGLDLPNRRVTGYLHHCAGVGECRWTAHTLPVPRVIYDRCFSREGRRAAVSLRQAVGPLGVVVLNHAPKITKLQAFAALEPEGGLAPYLPLTLPLSEGSLKLLAGRTDDLYLKPDSLYKGKGVCRLCRLGNEWELHSVEEGGTRRITINGDEPMLPQVQAHLEEGVLYVLQEGLSLATYLGNRFDLRSLVQRDGTGAWRVSGLVARIAPEFSPITSPRSGGQVAGVDSVFREAFGERAHQVLAAVERVSLTLAAHLDQRLGPCVELGLDLGIQADGSVKLIEVNGIPLRVSLQRLKDPLIAGRIDRYPILYAASLDRKG